MMNQKRPARGKISGIAALLVLVLLACCLPSARASAQLPLDIRAQFGSIEITDSAFWDSPGSTWFVLIRTPDKVNRLICYVLENGTWVQAFQSTDAVPQGEGTVRILFTNREREVVDGRTVIRPVLMITQNGTGENESRMIRQYEFMRSASDEWNLVRAFFPDGPMHLEFSEAGFACLLPDNREPDIPDTVPWTSPRDLRGISLAEIPETPEQVLQLINEPTENGLSGNDP